MAAILMLGDVAVAEWTGAGSPPWPIDFVPDGGTTNGSAMYALGWPAESMAGKMGSGELLLAYRGSPQVVPGLTILTPFHVWRVDRASDPNVGTAYPWTPTTASQSDWGAVTTSYQAALGPSAPVPLNWTNVGRVNFQVTDIPALKAQDAAVTATLGNSGGAYESGNPTSSTTS